MTKEPDKKCKHNYHDNLHPELCEFECILDAYLESNDKLTLDAQKLRDGLVEGVKRMANKVKNFETLSRPSNIKEPDKRPMTSMGKIVKKELERIIKGPDKTETISEMVDRWTQEDAEKDGQIDALTKENRRLQNGIFEDGKTILNDIKQIKELEQKVMDLKSELTNRNNMIYIYNKYVEDFVPIKIQKQMCKEIESHKFKEVKK